MSDQESKKLIHDLRGHVEAVFQALEIIADAETLEQEKQEILELARKKKLQIETLITELKGK